MVITWQNSLNWKVYPIERDLFPDPTHMRTIRVYLWLLGARPSAPQTQSKLKLSAFAPFKLDTYAHVYPNPMLSAVLQH